MPSTPSATPTPITPPRVPLIDQRTGLIDRSWYMFFLSMFGSAQNADAALLAPAVQSYDQAFAALEQQAATQPPPAQLAELEKQVQALDQTPPPAQLAELEKQIQALALAPPPREFRRPRYGTFYDTTTQTPAAINTAYAITFDTTDLSFGVYRGSPTSRIYVDTPSIYDFQFSIQLDNTSGGSHLIFVWCRINGSDVAQSASQVRLKGTDGELVAAWNFVLSMNAGDYFELVYSVSDTSVQIVAQGAAAPVPAIPSAILTVTNNISGQL